MGTSNLLDHTCGQKYRPQPGVAAGVGSRGWGWRLGGGSLPGLSP